MRLQAASAAGMHVLAVPSLIDQREYKAADCSLLSSLLDFRPEQYGLPAFGDQICGTVPLEHPWQLRGKVVRGFGRGSKVLAGCCL